MNLYINTNTSHETAKITASALRSYFSDIVINAPLENVGIQDAILTIEDSIFFLRIHESETRFDMPFKLGNLLHHILIMQKNRQAREKSEPISIGHSILYPERNILRKNEQDIQLTDKEFDIIHTIFGVSPSRMTRDVLLDKIWGYNSEIETHTLETHIYRLRQKIEDDPTNPNFLKTDDDGYYLNF